MLGPVGATHADPFAAPDPSPAAATGVVVAAPAQGAAQKGAAQNGDAPKFKLLPLLKSPTPAAYPTDLNAWYCPGAFDLASGTWQDCSGNGNRATLSGSGLAELRSAGHGATSEVHALTGTTSSVIDFGPVIPSEFTVCSVTRYTGGARGRILQGDPKNWLHGHFYGSIGVAYYEGWKTANRAHVSPDTDWVVMCGTNAGSQLKLVNGADVGTNQGGSGGVSLLVNAGTVGGHQKSNFAIAEVVVWPRGLTAEEMHGASQHLLSRLNPPWSCSPSRRACSDPPSGPTVQRRYKGHSTCRGGVCGASGCMSETEIKACCIAVTSCTAYQGGGNAWWTFHGECVLTTHVNAMKVCMKPVLNPISLTYTGSPESVALYSGGALDSCPRVSVTLDGAGGSPSTWDGSSRKEGGAGGRVSATLTLPRGTTTLYALVGQRGQFPARTAAWPDGGKGGPDGGNTGGGGGGRTALRLSRDGEDILTAGGGGGGGHMHGGDGGDGGGLSGTNGKGSGNEIGKGASQTSGGAAGVGSERTGSAGSKYHGGDASQTDRWGAGGGGGGYYGGGAGGGSHQNHGGGGGGGGGSGFAGPVAGVGYGNVAYSTGGGSSQNRDGMVSITFFQPAPCTPPPPPSPSPPPPPPSPPPPPHQVLQFESSTSTTQYATTALKLPEGAFSLIVLVRPGDPPGHGWIMDNGGGGGGCDESQMMVSQTGHVVTARWAGGHSRCQAHQQTATNPKSPEPLPVGAWTHLVGVFTQYTGQLYVNGTLVSEASYSTNVGSWGGPPKSNDYGFTFGASRGGAKQSPINASLWYAQVWDKALSATEVQSMYEAGPESGLGDQNLVAYWDAGSAGCASGWPDKSGNGWHATLQNDASCVPATPPSPPSPAPPPTPAPPLSSLAKLSATASLSSTYSRHYPASNCVDGDLDNFCHSAGKDSDPSLTLDLGAAIQIAHVAVYNRRSCCKERLADYTISYRVSLRGAWRVCSIAKAAVDATGPLLSECPYSARYVRVQLPGARRTLNLAEVEVYSPAPPPPPPSPAPPLPPGYRPCTRVVNCGNPCTRQTIDLENVHGLVAGDVLTVRLRETNAASVGGDVAVIAASYNAGSLERPVFGLQ